MLLLDTITNLFESFLYSYTVNYFCNKKNTDSKTILIGFILISALDSYSFMELFHKLWIRNVLSIIFIFLVIGIIYRHNLVPALMATSVITFIMLCITTIMQNNVCNILMNIFQSENNYIYTFLILCAIRWASVILQLKYIDKMYILYELILDGGVYVLVFLLVLNAWGLAFNVSDNYLLGLNNEILSNILTVLFFLFLIFALLYIVKISSKSQEINRLNLDLEKNNNKLRKIKHDYGAQISYLYGLSLMERYDDLKISLKNIIDKSDYDSKTFNEGVGSILSLALKSAVKSKDIKVTLEDRADLYRINMPEMELFRVLFNIINNAVEAMSNNGNIYIKSYELEGEIIIMIQNDGPEIPQDYLLKIFETGFTTKNNSEKGHGYGLSIVKELIEKNHGKINVRSSSELTEFRITFKI